MQVLQALEIGGPPQGIRSVYSNAVASGMPPKIHAAATQGYGFVLDDTRSTATFDVRNVNTIDGKMICFARTG